MYKINEPTTVSFSGGRTSAYMLWRLLDENGGLPADCEILFANTGCEMPETLDFIQACSDNWGVPIVWLEYAGRSQRPGQDADAQRILWDYQYKEVTHATASRAGEPFDLLMNSIGKLPNPMNRWCSGQLKARTMQRYVGDRGYEKPTPTWVGLRGDEPRRAAKLHNRVVDGQDIWCPLFVDGITKSDISAFWDASEFDLELPNNNGVTDWGNCSLCFLKGQSKRLSIIKARPDLADWWIAAEERFGDQFDRQAPSYKEMVVIATDQHGFDFGDDETIPCYCGD